MVYWFLSSAVAVSVNTHQYASCFNIRFPFYTEALLCLWYFIIQKLFCRGRELFFPTFFGISQVFMPLNSLSVKPSCFLASCGRIFMSVNWWLSVGFAYTDTTRDVEAIYREMRKLDVTSGTTSELMLGATGSRQASVTDADNESKTPATTNESDSALNRAVLPSSGLGIHLSMLKIVTMSGQCVICQVNVHGKQLQHYTTS